MINNLIQLEKKQANKQKNMKIRHLFAAALDYMSHLLLCLHADRLLFRLCLE